MRPMNSPTFLAPGRLFSKSPSTAKLVQRPLTVIEVFVSQKHVAHAGGVQALPSVGGLLQNGVLLRGLQNIEHLRTLLEYLNALVALLLNQLLLRHQNQIGVGLVAETSVVWIHIRPTHHFGKLVLVEFHVLAGVRVVDVLRVVVLKRLLAQKAVRSPCDFVQVAAAVTTVIRGLASEVLFRALCVHWRR